VAADHINVELERAAARNPQFLMLPHLAPVPSRFGRRPRLGARASSTLLRTVALFVRSCGRFLEFLNSWQGRRATFLDHGGGV
jgi:hypothetical protein